MKGKFYKKDNKIIIEIPFYSKRTDPYTPDEDVGEYPTLIGIIVNKDGCNEEYGLAYTIDMSYKGKPDQWTSINFYFDGEKEEFKKLCKKLGIEIFEYPACAYCHKSIFGTFTVGDKGSMCWECAQKYETK